MKNVLRQGIPSRRKLIAQAVSVVLLGCTTTAYAQTNDADYDNLEEQEVTGIRGSLKAALDSKRNATAIVDAINSEDIGKFPDKNVADSLQRIPGISVDRIWGEGRDIFVRGTDSTMNRTLMNGQNVASAYWWANDNASRGFNYSILASELVSGLEVYKSPEASHDEGSIGGMVNVKTRRPMDLESMSINGSAEYQYSDLPDEWDPQISGLISWKNDAETFGILASYNKQDRTVRRDGLEAFPTNTLYDIVDENNNVTENVYAVWGGGSAIFQQERERETTNVTLQFRPTDEWDIAFNVVNSDMDMDNSNQNYLFVVGGTAQAPRLDGMGNEITGNETIYANNPGFISTSDGRQAVVSGEFNVNGESGVAIEPIRRAAYVESNVYDLDATYQADSWKAHFQVGRTDAKGGSSEDVAYWFDTVGQTNLNLEPNAVEVSYPTVNVLDPAEVSLRSARDWVREMTDEETYFQGDVEFDLEWGAITSVELGAKFRDHTVENNRLVGTTDSNHPAWRAVGMDEVSAGVTPSLHGESATAGSLTQYAWLDFNKAIDVIHPIFDAGAMQYTTDTNAFFELNEEITAFYAQANFEVNEFTGNFGVRAIDTDQTSTAYVDGVIGSVSRSYTDYLPSVNVVYNVNDDLIIRAAASKAMARPTFTNLSANIVINATSGVATAGNPMLDPTYAVQYEIGAEWYYDDASILSATFFSKDLDTFVITSTATENIDGDNISVTRPSNASNGADLTGIELQWQQSFFEDFGIVTNYTWTDADTPDNNGQRLELPGNSENQMNVAVYYENDEFSVRLSYNYRDEAFGNLTSGSQTVTEEYDQFDATASWQATDEINVFFNAVNITNEIVSTKTIDGIPVGFYENGPRYSAGVRVKF